MRDFSKVSPTVWKSRKFRALNADSDARLAYLYILTNPHINSAGCYDLPKPYACADLEWYPDRFQNAIDTVISAGLILVDQAENTVLVTNWVKFNSPANPKHALGMVDQLEAGASSTSLKRQRYQEIKDDIEPRLFFRDKQVGATLRNRMETFFKQFGNGIITRPDRDRDLDREETKTEIETETQTESRAHPREGVVAAAPLTGAAPPPLDEIPDIPEALDRRGDLSHLLQTPLMRKFGR